MFNNITVIGSGLMGSAIAAHFANIGSKVNLLDIVDQNQNDRNYLAKEAIKKLSKIKPSPITLKSNTNYNENHFCSFLVVEPLNIL